MAASTDNQPSTETPSAAPATGHVNRLTNSGDKTPSVAGAPKTSARIAPVSRLSAIDGHPQLIDGHPHKMGGAPQVHFANVRALQERRCRRRASVPPMYTSAIIRVISQRGA